MFGGLVGDRIANRLGATGAIIFSYAIFASTDFVRALFPNVAVVVAMSVTMALAGTVWNVVTVSYRQRIIPAHLFGRVNSAYRFIGTGSVALGALIGGQLRPSCTVFRRRLGDCLRARSCIANSLTR